MTHTTTTTIGGGGGGGGLGGLTAAIACAEQGMTVELYEAHRTLGGRARSTPGPYVANDGTHAFYSDGEPFRWLARRGLVQPFSRPTLTELAGVRIAVGERVDARPTGPLIVATSLDAARTLLRDDTLRWPGGRAALLDLGLGADRRDPFLVSDLDQGGFLVRYSLPDPSLAPPGHALVQIEMPARDGESGDATAARAEDLADLGLPGWRDRVTWRRRATAAAAHEAIGQVAASGTGGPASRRRTGR